MVRLKQRKGLCPTVEDKNMWSNLKNLGFSNKVKASETLPVSEALGGASVHNVSKLK